MLQEPRLTSAVRRRRPGRIARIALALAVLAIVARLATQFALGFFDHPVTWEYQDLAVNLVRGNGYVIEHNGTNFHAFSLPLYPFLLAATYEIFGVTPVGAALLHMALGAALTLVVFDLTRRVGGMLAATVAGALVATHPGLLVFSAEVHSLSLDALLPVLGVLLLVQIRASLRIRGAVVLGLVTGAMALDRPTALVFMVLGFALTFVTTPRARGAAGPVLLWIAVALVIPGMWVTRNALLLGEPVLTTTGAEVLWVGNNPDSTGGALREDGTPVLDGSEMEARTWGRSELVQERLFSAATSAYILADPLRAVRGDLAKERDYWWPSSRVGIEYPAPWVRVYLLYYAAILALATLGLVVLARKRLWRISATYVLAFLTISLGQSLIYVEGRHRWEIEPLLLSLAGVGAAAINQVVARAAQARRGTT